jgi:hypothetical protein
LVASSTHRRTGSTPRGSVIAINGSTLLPTNQSATTTTTSSASQHSHDSDGQQLVSSTASSSPLQQSAKSSHSHVMHQLCPAHVGRPHNYHDGQCDECGESQAGYHKNDHSHSLSSVAVHHPNRNDSSHFCHASLGECR